MSDHRKVERIVDDLLAQGATAKRTKNGWLIFLPDGSSMGLHLTESDHRADKNSRARVRRAGLEWPPDTWGRRR